MTLRLFSSTIESVLGAKEQVTSADIRKELFEGDNVPRGAAVQNAIDRGLLQPPVNQATENVKVEITEKDDNKDNEKDD